MSATFDSSRLRVRLPQGHAPGWVVHALAAAQEIGRERVVLGIEGRKLRAERHARGAGEGGEVEDEIGLLLVGERQRVGEDETTLRVRVADLDGEPLAARQDVAGPEGRARNGILDRRNEHPAGAAAERRP